MYALRHCDRPVLSSLHLFRDSLLIEESDRRVGTADPIAARELPITVAVPTLPQVANRVGTPPKLTVRQIPGGRAGGGRCRHDVEVPHGYPSP